MTGPAALAVTYRHCRGFSRMMRLYIQSRQPHAYALPDFVNKHRLLQAGRCKFHARLYITHVHGQPHRLTRRRNRIDARGKIAGAHARLNSETNEQAENAWEPLFLSLSTSGFHSIIRLYPRTQRLSLSFFYTLTTSFSLPLCFSLKHKHIHRR